MCVIIFIEKSNVFDSNVSVGDTDQEEKAVDGLALAEGFRADMIRHENSTARFDPSLIEELSSGELSFEAGASYGEHIREMRENVKTFDPRNVLWIYPL